ncbi:MAG: hypothetical protein RKO66_04620 [Candidatus Contendobacter sp.]|nr:hypothetical protein [Candidatus Contendobacter sp.]MDS4060609.1 hypothetical protein [Candidatus Contendobacter sp.]
MNTTFRIRRAQLRGVMTARQAREIAILRQGHRLVHAGTGSRLRAALAGITEYWTARDTPVQLQHAGRDSRAVLDPGAAGLGNSIIPLETAVW